MHVLTLPRSPCVARRCALDEFELIQRYFVRESEARGVITGIGDDGAVLQPEPGKHLVSVIDTLVGGVHFPTDISPADLGYRVVAVNLSDVAAMGGRPLWMTLALAIPESNAQWISDFASGVFDAAVEHEVALVGGDTTRGDQVVVTAQITGDVAQGKAIHRSGANVGDTIYVTGTVGDAAGGLERLSAGARDDYLVKRYLRPTARVGLGQALVGVATAAIDLSDGLYGDLHKLLQASGVGGEINLEHLPLSDSLRSAFDGETQRCFALSGGDDYELCFTAGSGAIPRSGDLRITAIGTVTEGDELICRENDTIVEYADSGYRHFQ